MKSYILTRTPYFWILLILSTIILVSHGFYVSLTNQQPEMDEQHYMDMGATFYRLLQNPSFDTPIKMLEHIPFRQPGYSLVFLPILLIFGLTYSYAIALFTNGILYITTVICIYFLGKEFYSKKSAIIATIVFACYGWPLFYLHFTYSETATACFVILSLYFLKRSNFFIDKKYAILFGLFFGIGLLTRWVTIIFIAGPLLLSIFYIKNYSKKKRRSALKNLAISIGLGSLIASPPYVINWANFFGNYVRDQALGGALWEALPKNKKSFLSLYALSYYWKVFEQLTFPIFSLFIAGLLFLIAKRKNKFLLIAFFVPLIVFSFGTIIKDDRYIVPIYPYISLISVSFLDQIKKPLFKTILISLVLVLSIGNFFGAIWGIGPWGYKGLASTLIPMPVGHPRLIHWTTIVWPPRREISNAKKVFEIIDKNSVKKKEIRVTQLFSYHPVDIGIYSINNYMRKEKMTIDNFVGSTVNDPKVSSQYVIKTISNSDFILTKNKNQVDNYFPPVNYELLKVTIKTLYENILLVKGFTLVGRVKVPSDKSTIYVYKKTGNFENKRELNEYLEKNLSDYITDSPKKSNDTK